MIIARLDCCSFSLTVRFGCAKLLKVSTGIPTKPNTTCIIVDRWLGEERSLDEIPHPTHGRPLTRTASLLARYRSFRSGKYRWPDHRIRSSARGGRRPGI